MFQRTFLTGLAITLLVVQACGSDDGKKRSRSADDGGAGGEAGGPDSGMNISGAPAAGQPPVNEGGAGGAIASGGAGGEPPLPSSAGAGGEPPSPYVPEPELLFSVKADAVGLDETGIRAAEFTQNLIYTSNTGSQAHVDGSNAVKITGESLGLAADDSIVAFALPQAEPTNPLYLFSLADGSEGAFTARSYSYYQDEGTAESELFYSDGVQSFRDLGEGGDELGYNALFASESSLGLARGFDGPDDDLTGMAVHDAKQPITEVYFIVNDLSVGADGSALGDVPPDERGCTVFKSDLDDAHSVAYSCADLGLLPGDQLDALAIYATADSADVVFSLRMDAQGAVGSGVEATRLAANRGFGATLFRSAGDTSNTLFKAAKDFGLGDNSNYSDADDIDGLAVVDQPKASVAHAASCELTYDPFGADAEGGGGLTYVTGTSSLGNNVLVVWGQTATQSRLIAYNANTCAFLQQQDLPAGFEYPGTVAIAPLTGWAPGKPLDNVEYWIAAYEAGYGKELRNYDATGTYVATFSIDNSDNTSSIQRLLYHPASDQLYLLMSQNYYGPQSIFTVLPRPDGVKLIEADFKRLALPCAADAEIAGLDTAGNLYLASAQNAAAFDYRVCAYAPHGELLPAPYTWNSDIDSNATGFIVPGGSHFLINTEVTPMVIERGVFRAP